MTTTTHNAAVSHAAIRRAVAEFKQARRDGNALISEMKFEALSEALADQGFAVLILDSTVYLGNQCIGEMLQLDDDHGGNVFSSAYLLNLDAC